MKRRLVYLAIFWLVFRPDTLCSPACAASVADSQGSLPGAADPKVDIWPPALAAPGTVDQKNNNADTTLLPPRLGIGADASPELQDNEPSVSIPCLHGFHILGPIKGIPAESQCAEQPDGQQRFSFQFGRHLGNSSSLLSDVDGVRVDYRLTGGLTLNGVAGYPVLSADDNFNTSRRVLGISADMANFAGSWEANSYMVQQQDNGRVVSRTVGGAMHYLQSERSLLFYLDHDVAEKSRSVFMASGTLKLTSSTRISAMLDIRNGPVQKRQQKYLQTSMAAVEGWKWMLPSDRIKHFTRDGAREVLTLSVGLSHAFSKRITLSSEFAVLDASQDKKSDGPAFGQSNEYFSSLKLSTQNLMVFGDSNILDLRQSLTDSSQISSVSFNSRYDINRYWKISPRFSNDYHSNAHDNSVRWVRSPAVKMEYNWREQYGFQLELGGKWSKEVIPDTNKNSSTYFVGLGYQAKF